MKKFFLAVAISLFANSALAQTKSNLEYLNFKGLDLDMNGPWDTVVKKRSSPISRGWLYERMSEWEKSIQKAALMLPPSFFTKMGKVDFYFFADQGVWATGTANFRSVSINLKPSIIRPKWMKWETFPLNGFSEIERIWIALHELGHIYDYEQGVYKRFMANQFWGTSSIYTETGVPSISLFDISYDDVSLQSDRAEYREWDIFSDYSGNLISHYVQFFGTAGFNPDYSPHPLIDISVRVWHVHKSERTVEIKFRELSPTLYGDRNLAEDFADSFALYVLWPEKLKKNFPARYSLIKDILGVEYRTTYREPNSVTSKRRRVVR